MDICALSGIRTGQFSIGTFRE